MRSIERFIPHAIQYLKADREKDRPVFFDRRGGKAFSTYIGYTASFGTMVKTSGALPAVLVFSDTSGNSDKDKSAIPTALLHFLMSESARWQADTLLNLVLVQQHNALLRKQIMDASIALKLALRTFPLDK